MTSLRKCLAILAIAGSCYAQSEPATGEVSIQTPPPPRYVGPILRPFHLEKRIVPAPRLTNSPRLETLVRGGNLYLTAQDVIALVLENNLETEPIFSLLEDKYDTPLVEAEYILEAVSADAVVARALGVKLGSPIFLIERTSYSVGNQPIDYEKLYYRGDQIRFVSRLTRRSKAEPRSRK